MSQADLDKLVEDRDYQFAQKIAYEFKDMKVGYALQILDRARQMILERSTVTLSEVPIEWAMCSPDKKESSNG